jgi:hypothetical protein
VAIITGQDKLNQALHQEACDGKWALRVEDPCNGLKLDAIVDALGGTSAAATVKTIYNEIILLADVEQSLSINGTIVGYMIKSRGGKNIKLSHIFGESSVKFLTIRPGSIYIDEHRYNNLTLYFQSPAAGDIIEIITWS